MVKMHSFIFYKSFLEEKDMKHGIDQREKRRHGRRMLAWFLTAAMLLQLFSMPAFAELSTPSSVPEAVPAAETEDRTDVQAETGTDVQTGAEAETHTDVETDKQAEAETDTKTDVQAEAGTDLQTGAQGEMLPEADPDAASPERSDPDAGDTKESITKDGSPKGAASGVSSPSDIREVPSALLREEASGIYDTATPSEISVKAMAKQLMRTQSDRWLRLHTIWYPYPYDPGAEGTDYYTVDLLEDPEPGVFSASATARESFSGSVRYDEDENTLYLTDFRTSLIRYQNNMRADYVLVDLDMNAMGEIRIVVEGENILDSIQCFDSQLTIDGIDTWEEVQNAPSLFINAVSSDAENTGGNVLYLEGEESSLTIGNHLFLYSMGTPGQDGGWGSGPINVNGTNNPEALRIEGELSAATDSGLVEGKIAAWQFQSGLYRLAVSTDGSFDHRTSSVMVSPADWNPEDLRNYISRKVRFTVPEELREDLDGYDNGRGDCGRQRVFRRADIRFSVCQWKCAGVL